MVKDVAQKHIDSMKEDYQEALYIDKLVMKDNKNAKEDIFSFLILKLCINYESFTTQAFEEIFPKKKVKYNHPWSYTRVVAKKLKIDISKEYVDAHESWNIYNTLKHLNQKTAVTRQNICLEQNLKTFKEMAEFIMKSLIELLSKFLV